MAQLSSIIGSILRDMILAQHEANMYAISLKELYRKEGRLKDFSLPAVAVGEMDLFLQYGVKNDVMQKEQFEINYSQLAAMAQDVSLQLAHAIVDKVLPLLQAAFPYDGTDQDAKLLADFAADKSLQQEYCSFLSRKILNNMRQCFTALVNDDGSISDVKLRDCVMAACEMHLVYFKDLQVLFNRLGGNVVREKVRAAIQELLEAMLPGILKDINMKRKRLLPSVDVTLNSEELAKLPEISVHSLRIHVSPDNIKLYSED